MASIFNEDENGIISISTNQIQNKLESTPEDDSNEKGSLKTWYTMTSMINAVIMKTKKREP